MISSDMQSGKTREVITGSIITKEVAFSKLE
jgi:hypothetical protein